LAGEKTTQSPPKDTFAVAIYKSLTPAQAEQVTRKFVEDEAERELSRTVEKYREVEKQSGKRVQVCISVYDETTYNFLHLGTEWTHGFWQKVNHATARKLCEQGFFVRFVNLDLDVYMAWLARENLRDSSGARARFAAAIADREMGIKSEARDEWYCDEVSGEAPKKQVQADLPCDLSKRDRWTQLAKITLITVAVAALAGFVGVYTFNALNGAGDIRVSRSPEIRRAVPVEPEIRRASPVKPEIRKAIPVRSTRARAQRQNSTLTE
jgi:hypothetical protein